MLRKFALLSTFTIAFCLVCGLAMGQAVVSIDGSQAQGPVLQVDRSDFSAIDLTLTVSALDKSTVTNTSGSFTALSLADHGFTSEVGRPRLPVVREFIEIPHGATYELVLSNTVFVEQELAAFGIENRIVPAQAPVPKNVNRDAMTFVIDEGAYAVDAYAFETVARVTGEAVMRGRRLAVLEVFPVDYNPAAGTLKVLKSAQVQVKLTGADVERTVDTLTRLSSQHFNRLASKVVLNAATFETPILARNPKGSRGVGYLIISAPTFMSNTKLLNLIALRETQNFDVTLVDTGTTGTSASAIKSYIENAYNTQNTEFVLLVGDTNLIPYWNGSGSSSPTTDLNYACVDGSDYFPDVVRGRFPVRTATQLDNICQKILDMAPQAVIDAVFMASEDNYNISEGTHNYCINTYLDPAGWTCDKLYCHTYNATTTQVTNSFNAGRTIGIYSGHGYSAGWADGPAFDQNNVRALVNTVYPLVHSYACSTSPFDQTECFGETWVVDDHGATSFFGASLSSYWTEDDVLEKAMFDGWYLYGTDRAGTMIDYGQYELWLFMGEGSFTRMYFEMYNLLGEPAMPILDASSVPDFPSIDLLVNGSHDPDPVPQGTNVTLSISVDPGDDLGVEYDWWIWAQRNTMNKYWYVHNQGWIKSATPRRATGVGLREVIEYQLLNYPLPSGYWVFTFAVDDKDNIYGETMVETISLNIY